MNLIQIVLSWVIYTLYFNSIPYLILLGIFWIVAYYFTNFPWTLWRVIGIPCAIVSILLVVGIFVSGVSPFEDSFFLNFISPTLMQVANLYGLIYLFSELFHWGSQTYQPVASIREILNERRAIPLIRFTMIYIVYSIISQFIFLITSGGITAFTETLSWILVFLFWLVLLGSRFYRTEKLLEPYFWQLIVGILLLQIFTSLFNPRICFSGRLHNFIQHLLYKIMGGGFSDLCSVSKEQISESFPFIGTEPWIPFEIVFLARVLYYILNLILILVP